MILFAALMIFDLLFLWAVSTTRAWWSAKFVAAVIAVAVNFGVMHAFNDGAGWPKVEFPGQGVQFLNCYVVPPVPQVSSGAIYLEVVPSPQKPPIGYTSHDGSPQLFVVPYSGTLYRECLAANKAVQSGATIYVKKGGGHGRPSGHGQHLPGRYTFYQLPPSHPTPKPRGQHAP